MAASRKTRSKKKIDVVDFWRRFITPVELLFVLLAVFCWIIYNIPALDDHRQARAELEFQKKKVEQLDAEIRGLNESLTGAESGQFYDEKAIRERYRMVKPGERLIQLEYESE